MDNSITGRPAHLGDFQLRPRFLLITAIALPIGAVAALTALALLRLIGLITNLVFYQRFATGLIAPGAVDHPWWLVLTAPVAGGLLIGVMARFGSEKIRGHGMPEAIEAILTGGSRVAPRVAVLKPVSAAISIGTGGPFGAEGPIIMTGGAVGSILAQLLKLSADERKTLLVAGSAGGMAATFNAPLASILLAVELLLFEWRPRSFVPVTASVVVAAVCRGFLLGSAPIFGVPAPDPPSAATTGLALIPGLTGGLMAIAATVLVYLAEDGFARLPVHWMWWPAIGGLIIGVGGLAEPRALGVGYDVIDQLLTGHATANLIIGILIVKTLIWSLSLGSGTSGGVLAPVFMIGAALGAAEGSLLPHLAPGLSHTTPGFWAMCGLAAVVGGVMRSPLTGIVFTLELTHAWNNLLPLVVASATAYALSALLLKRSVLTEKIARRRLHLTREYTTDPLETFFAHEVMTPHPAPGPNAPATPAPEPPPRNPAKPRSTAARSSALARPDLAAEPFPGAKPDPVAKPDLPGTDEPDLTGGPGVAKEPNPAATPGMAAQPGIVVVHADDTLREVANKLAAGHVTQAAVISRTEPDRVVGTITVAQLLHARRRDLHEERHRERVLMVNGRKAT